METWLHFPKWVHVYCETNHTYTYLFLCLDGLRRLFVEIFILKTLKKKPNIGVRELKHVYLLLFSHRILCVITGYTGVGRRENVSSVVR